MMGAPTDNTHVHKTFTPILKPPSRLEDDDSSIWPLYLERTGQYDSNRVARWNSDMDVLLIFAGLFSVIVSVFIVESMRDLREDYSKTSSELLRVIVSQSLGQNTSIVPSPYFKADQSSIIVNALWFTSFVLSLGTSLGALLIKEWLRCYTAARPSPTPEMRMVQRHATFSAFERWNTSLYIELLPAILRVSMLIFFAGLCTHLGPINETVRNVTATIITVIGAFYVALTFLPLFTSAPFVTPATLLITRFLQKSMDFVLALGYAMFLFAITVIPVAVQARSIASVVKTFKQWTIVVRHSFQRVLHMTGFIMIQEKYEHQESDQAEMLTWLIRNAPDNDSMGQIVQSLSHIQSYASQRVFVKHGVDVILLNHLQASCFHRYGPGVPWKPITERIPFALSCLDALTTIASSTSTTVQNAAWMGFPTDEMITSLLQVMSGHDHDRLRVQAAAVWLVNDHKKSLDYRRDIQRHLVDHISGLQDLPDNIVKALVDALHPSLDFISASELTRLLKRYLERDTLPSYACLHSILFNLYGRSHQTSDDPAHRSFTAMYYIAHLLDKEDPDRSLYLFLIRKMTLDYGLDSLIDVDLSRSLFGLLDWVPAFHETQIIDILETISHSPTSCYADDQPLLRLGRLYESSTSEAVSRATIAAIASFMESVFRSYNPQSDSLVFDVAKQTRCIVRIVAWKLIYSPDVSFDDKETVSFSIYVFSLASSYVTNAFSLVPIDELLRALVKVLFIPNSDREIVHHAVQVVRAVVVANRSMGAVLAEFLSVWELLVADDDPLIRWPSCDILVFVSFYIHRKERVRVFEAVRADIYRRLQSPTGNPFVDPYWRTLTDCLAALTVDKSEPPPRVALAQEVMSDLRRSGIVELLDGVSRSMVCEKSGLVPEDFFWLIPIYFKAD